MNRLLSLLPFALLIVILPFPGTVAARLLLLVVCFGIALWHWLRVPGARAEIPCKPALFLWWCVCIASLAYSIDPGYTAEELKNELGYTMMAFFSFFVLAADRQAALWLFRAVASGFALIGFWAALAWAGNGRVWNDGGQHGGMGGFSAYLVTVVPVLAWLAFVESSLRIRRIAAGLLLFAMFLAVISLQRATWPALAAQALIILVHAYRRRVISWRRMAAAIVATGVLAAAGTQYIQQARSSSPVREPALTSNVRWAFWPKVEAKIAEHPLAGAGFGRNMMQKAYPELTPVEVPDLWHAHNVLLNYGLQLGVPGMIALLVLFAAFARVLLRSVAKGDGWTGVAGIAMIVGVLLRNQFNDFFVRDLSLLFWALLAMFVRASIAARPASR